MSDFEKYWEESASKESWTNKAVAWSIWKEKQAKIDELQKRVDAAKQLIEDLNKCYQQDHQNKFEYWRGFADSAGILGKRLEQALKGGNE